jgi:hypothetical protein
VLAVPVGGLERVVKQLKKSTIVPVVLPQSVPDSLTGTAVYGRVTSVSRNAYLVALASTRSCNGSPTCLLETASGELKKPSSLGRSVKLPNGTQAYYDGSALTWKKGVAWYRLRIVGTSLYSLRMATTAMRRF